ncbi:hypothetical protein BRD03_07105 [Halobacteriales archaeon QS_9_68_17]|nr:MAG: hypothetical protein BRD03_07105 [Halobacteriales archaeon QS_9_68_17]
MSQTDGKRTTNAQNTATTPDASAAIRSILLDGEEILVDSRPAWSAWSFHLIAAGLLVVGSLLTSEPAAIGGGIVVAGVIAAYVWFQREKVRYLVTDRRIVVVTGISSRQTNETWMEDVRGMQTGASFVERILGHGHITVSDSILSRGSLMALSGIQGLTLGGISNYEEIANVVRNRQAERKAGTY